MSVFTRDALPLTPAEYAGAFDFQDASNLYAVVRAFTQYIDLIDTHLQAEYMADYALHEHPIAVLVASKIVAMVPEKFPVESHEVSRGALRMYAQGLRRAISSLREEGGFAADEAYLRSQPIVRWFVGTIAMATRCEDASYFSLAYEACQHGMSEGADLSEEWLNKVIGPERGVR